MTDEDNKVYYSKVHARLLIVLGFIFSAIFIMGFIILNSVETLLYCLFSSFMIIIGFSVLNVPYIYYDEHHLILFHFHGKERERFEFRDKSAIQVKNNHLYYKGKKIRANDWFLEKGQWQRLINFYSNERDALLEELQDVE